MKKVLFLFLIVLATACGESKPIPNITVEFRNDAEFLHMLNKGSGDLTELEVTINDDYTYKFKAFPNEKWHTVGWILFTNDDNERFNIDRYKVQKISISGTNNQGEFCFGLYNFQ